MFNFPADVDHHSSVVPHISTKLLKVFGRILNSVFNSPVDNDVDHHSFAVPHIYTVRFLPTVEHVVI